MSRLHTLKCLFISFAAICPILLRAQSPAAPTFTTINVNNTVLQSQVKRLGMNLGQANYYDSGQMMKNLIVSNPGFEGQISQSMIQCSAGTATSCTDLYTYTGWPADYWDGATYTFVYGAAMGRTGTISTFTPASTANNIKAVFNFAEAGPAPSPGDYMIVSKRQPGNAFQGWNYTLGSNGTVSTNTTDLPPDTVGQQTVVLTAPAAGDSATLTYYFDSTAGRSFVQLNGDYNLSFKAKAVSGSGILYVALKRLTYPSPVYVYQVLNLTNEWKTYNFPFSASENGLVGTAELDFSTSAYGQATVSNQVELDDTSLVQLKTDPTNPTVFRDSVVNTLKQLNPGELRFWFNQLGETLDNLLAPPLGRQRSAYSAFHPDVDYVSYGLGEFLQLCQTVGTGASSPVEPWIVLPMTLSNAEASNLIDYLAGPTSTKYGAIRAASGQTAPWTSVFPKIHLELGNEAWNNLFYGGNMTSQQAYGTRGQTVFGIMRNNANYNPASFDLMLNGTAYAPGNNGNIQFYCNNNDSFAAQPYMILNANDPNPNGPLQSDPAAIETLFGSTFAEAEAFVTPSGTAEGIGNGLVLQNQQAVQSSGRPVAFAVTETNISPYGGSITQDELDNYVTSLGAGLATVDSMLQNMRIGVVDQNIFQLPEYRYYRGDGKAMYLFGSVVDMGVTDLKRPQFLAEQVANNGIGASTTMLQTVHTGLDPTWNQPSANSVQLNNAHYLQSFAYTSGDTYSLIILNTNRSASEQVNFAGANVPGGTVQMTRLTSAHITDTNEAASVVAPVSSTLPNFNAAAGLTLPPYSMTVLTWSAPAISNVTVTQITGTSATISWTTDDANSTAVVNYGTTTAYGSQSAPTAAGTTTQSVTLTGLTAGTNYNFAVTAINAAGATASSANFTFGTTASFTVSAPASVSLGKGQNGTVPVLVTDTDGYNGSVTLSISGLPAGVIGTFAASSGGASLALSVSSTALGGTYPLTITGTAGGTSVTASLSLVVSGASQSQTITFDTIPNQYVGAQVTPAATASSGLAVTFSVVQNGNCSVSGSTIKFLKVGNCGIVASQAGNSTYQPVSVGQIVVVSSASPSQTITFNSIPNQTVGSPLSLIATASSGLPVSFTSSTTGVCTVSGVTASFVAAGTCTITASQAGNGSYGPAQNVPQSFNVVGQPQTITFPAISTQTAGTTLPLGATATSGLSVSFASTTPSVCSVSGTTLTLNTAGNCTVTASQAGNSAFAAATPVQQIFTVNAALQAQTITFGVIAAQNVGTPLTLTASASSGLAVSYAASPSSVCTVANGIATFIATGNCTVTASQAGDSTHSAATPVSQTFAVNVALKTQTITFGAIADQYVGTPLTLSATSSANLAVTFVSTTTGICTVSTTSGVSTAQFIAAGTCTIVASQAGNTTYAAATPVTQNIKVNPTAYTQTITFNPIATQTVGTPLTLTATASSNLAVSYAATTTSVCAVSGSTVTFIAAGQCSITASQPGNSGYQAATPVTQSFTVNPGPQTITFGPIAAQTVGTPLTLTATSSSGLAVGFASTTSSVCTVSGTTATFLAAGQCGITASQAGNSSYAAATPVTQSFTVNPALQSQTITFGAIAAQTVGTPLTLSATASSGLAVGYASSTTGVCTVSNGTATFLAAGTCSITASQAGNSTFSAATPVTQTITVNAAPKAQTITFGVIGAQQVGTPLTLNASASSGLTVSYASNSASVCTISGTTATFVASGTCSITASQSGSSAYTAAPKVTQSFTVNGQGQVITFNAIPAQQVGASLTLSAKASSGLAVSFAASPSSVCSVSGTTASFVAAGTCLITASQAGNSTYAAASVSQSVSVQGGATTITSTTPVSLGSAANVYGIFSDGSSVTNGGFDNGGYAYSANLLGSNLASQGIPYSFGTPGSANGASATTLTLPAGSYSSLNFVGAAVFGNQPSQTFTVTYTDGTTSTFTQSLSDWGSPQSYSGETAASSTAYRLTPSAAQQPGPWNLYSYSFALNSAKTVKSFTLPNNRNVVVLSVTLSTTKTIQTITFGAIPTQTAGTTLALQATASSGLTVSYAATPSSVCSVSGTTASFAAAGTCTITASQAGNGTYAPATAVSQSITVQAGTTSTATTTVSMASVANIYAIFNNGSAVTNGGLDTSSYAYSANLLGTSLTLQGIPYSFGTPGSANGASSTTLPLPSGNYTALNFLGTAIYGNQASQTFTLTYTDGTTATFTQSLSDWASPQSYTGETAASKMAYRLGYDGSQQAGSWYLYSYSFALNSAKTVKSFTLPNNRNVVVLAITLSGAGSQQAAQTITFGSIAAQAVGTPLTLNAAASSGLAVTYASSTTSICTVSGSTATFVAAGTCTITASQAGNASYAAAASVSQSFTVTGQAQAITFNAIAAQTVATPLTLNASASSGLPVSYASSTTSICTVSGSTATFIAAGTCTITASQAGNSAYAAASPVSQSFTVNAALQSQAITFNAIAAQTVGTPLTLNASASSGLAVSFASSTTSICTVSGSTATFVAAGTCTITASQAGNATYSAATPVSQSFSVNAAALKTQTITFGSIATQTVGTPLTLNATASSGLAVSYASSTTSICTVSGSTATFVAPGTCTITASQAGNATYSAATPVSQSFSVNGALKAQTITFGTIAAQTVGTPLTLNASASSGLAVSYASSTTSICTVSGGTATFVAAGTCTITASQAGNATYSAATPVSQSFSVNAAALKTQTITFGSIATQTVGTPLTLNATASSGLAISYASSTTSICTVSGSTATFVAAGTCTITASQAGNATYSAATPVSQSFSVNTAALKTQTITFGSIATQTVGTPLTLNATASSGLAVSYASSTTSICTVSGGTATFVAAGTCTITASQAGNSTYAAATPVSQSFTVQAAATATTVSLGSAANIYGIFNDGSSVTRGGFDGASYAYSAKLLGTGVTTRGIPYSFGTPGSANAASATTLTLPSGRYTTLNFAGAAVFGNQPSQTFTVTYTDGTTSTFTQSMSDWGSPQSYSGETSASTMAYRLTSNGAQQAGPWYVYSYSFALNSAKTVKSFRLPNNRDVVVLAVTLR